LAADRRGGALRRLDRQHPPERAGRRLVDPAHAAAQGQHLERPAGEAAFAARRDDRTGVYSFEQARDPALPTADEARFRANEPAWAWFSAKAPSFRKQALHWVISAKRPETRERRLAMLIEDSAAGRPIKPMR
jgi:uncharacterized protein YdeI (YjbR/CyaY-like superfamily)